MKSKIITVSGTSGGGKSFLVDEILNKYSNIHEIAGITTRSMRSGEENGKSSYFYSLDYFNQLEEEGKLLLVKEIFGNKYAWLKKDLVNTDELRIMNISYKSIQELKDLGLKIFSIFVRPVSQEALEKMLRNRPGITEEEFTKRIKDYQESEMFLEKYYKDFDMVYVNDYNETTVENFVEKIFDFGEEENTLGIKELINESNRLDEKIAVADKLLCDMEKNEKGKNKKEVSFNGR